MGDRGVWQVFGSGSLIVISLWAAWQDLRKRSVSYLTLMLLGGCGLLKAAAAGRDAGLFLTALLPGLFLLFLTRLFRNGMGEGDAWFFLCLSGYFSASEIVRVFAGSCFISCMIALIIAVHGICTGSSIKGKTLPFLSCALLPITAAALSGGIT